MNNWLQFNQLSLKHQNIHYQSDRKDHRRYLPLIESLETPSTNSFDTITSTYPCYRCQAYKVVIRQLQLRSADEGATTIYLCLSCGSHQPLLPQPVSPSNH